MVAGGDSRPALYDHARGRTFAKHSAELRPQLLGGLEASIGLKVRLPEPVHGTGDVAADRIDRFVLAGVPVRRTGIDDQPLRIGASGLDSFYLHRLLPRRLSSEPASREAGLVFLDRQTRLDGSLPSAVEQCHPIVSQPAGQPPESTRILS